MKVKIRPVVVIAMLVVLTACNKGGNPSAPSMTRNSATFSNAVQIFTPAEAKATFGFQNNVAGFNDIALGSLAYGNFSVDHQGQQVNVNDYGTAAVSLMRTDMAYPHYPFKPVFRWLQGDDLGGLGTPSVMDWVNGWDNTTNGYFGAEFKAPKCKAIFFRQWR